MANLMATDYRSLQQKLESRYLRKIGNNTYAETDASAIIRIRLHSTYIVHLTPDTIRINSGGYHTTTTKERINQFLPSRYALVQRRYEWFIADRHNDWQETPFYDHMTFKNGELVPPTV